MASSSTFQSTTVFNQLCASGEPSHGDRECCRKVQDQPDLDQGGQGQPQMVVCSRQKGPNAVSFSAPGTDHDNRVGCLQHGVGSPTRQAPDGWKVVPGRDLSPHKLSRTASCLSSSNENGQCHNGDICQQTRGNALLGTLSACSDDLGLVRTERCFSGSRTPTGEGQYSGRSGIAILKGSLRLDAIPLNLPANTTADGPPEDRPICIPTDEATTELLQTRSGSNCDGCLQPGLGSDEGICQPPMVLDSTLPESDKETNCKSGDNHPTVGIATMVPDNSGNARGLLQDSTSEGGSSYTPSRSGIHNEPRSTSFSGMARIQESFES